MHSFTLIPKEERNHPMASPLHCSYLLKCELTIIELKNLDVDLPAAGGSLFIRYHIHAGAGKRLRVDTREISCAGSSISWNEKALFECRAASTYDNPISKVLLERRSVVFELRWRRRRLASSVFGLVSRRSKLLARVELPWKDAVEQRGVDVERWVGFVPASRALSGVMKMPKVLVGMRVLEEEGDVIGRRGKWRDWRECDCQQCQFAWKGGEDGDVCF